MRKITQYSIRPKRAAIRAQVVYFLHSTMPSLTCLRLFPIQSAFLQYIGRQAATAMRRTIIIGFNTPYRTSGVAENLGRYLSCAERTSQGRDFELILTVKMETRHP